MSVTRGSHVEVFNVAIASQSCISENMLSLNQIENGHLTYEDNNGVSLWNVELWLNSDFRMLLVCVFHRMEVH
jgi:hypothetical protein